MTKIILNKWNNGISQEVRTNETNKADFINNFNIHEEAGRLVPYADSIAETGGFTMDDVEISDVVIAQVVGTNYLVGAGYESGVSTALTFYTKTTIGGNFAAQASASGNVYQKGTLISYKTYAFAVDYNGSNHYRLIRYNSAGSTTTIGTISYTATSATKVLTFVHPEDNLLYIVIGNLIYRYDGSSLSSVFTLNVNYSATSMTNYGGYLAITMNPVCGNDNAICYLWNRDSSITTVQQAIDLGEGYVGIVENLNGLLVFVMSPTDDFSTKVNNKIIIKVLSGTVETVFEKTDSSTLSIGIVNHIKAKKNNRLYFGFNNSNSIYCFGKNKDGRWILSGDRFIINGELVSTNPKAQTISGLSIVGDIMWIGANSQTGVYSLQRSASISEQGYTATSNYRTVVNPNMPLADKADDKKLDRVYMVYTGASSGTIGLKYTSDSTTFTTVISQATSAGEGYVEAYMENSGLPFNAGREFQFQLESTGGVKIKEFGYEYTKIA